MEKINFKKKYGQNFLSDTNLLKAIVNDSGVTVKDEVLEIGAGAGALTTIIAPNCLKLISFEIDLELEELLKEKTKDFNNVQLIFNDIMKVKTKDIDSLFANSYKMIANLPYYITSPIIFKFLEESTKLSSMTIMVQKEVAEKLVAQKSSSNYGVLTVMANHYADIKIARIVGKQMFRPVPKVDSAIVLLKRKQVPFNEGFRTFVKTAFSNRRKTLLNNLSALYSKSLIQQVFENLGCNVSSRAEELSVLDFEKLFSAFDKITTK